MEQWGEELETGTEGVEMKRAEGGLPGEQDKGRGEGAKYLLNVSRIV